jgi:endonuclease/exonuclease/phosphatase family metal-dependent hydrolase
MQRTQTVWFAVVATCFSLAFSSHTASMWRNQVNEVEIANLNLLHGFDCDPLAPAEGDQCRLADRIDLLFEHLVDIGCPDIVTLQEIVDREFVSRGLGQDVGPLDSAKALIEAKLAPVAEVCGFQYKLLYLPAPSTQFEGTDEELILSRYPIVDSELRLLHSALFPPGQPFLQFFARHVLFARIDHPVGMIDVFTTHLSSSGDFASNTCNSRAELGGVITIEVACPSECEASQTVRECQARQLALFVEERHDIATPAYVSGDMNAGPESNEYSTFVSRGWVDTHLAGENAACDAVTGIGCTSGRDAIGGELELSELHVDERIDYVFMVPGDASLNCELVRAERRRSRLFAYEPNPFADACGMAPLPVCWASDHSGNFSNFRCPESSL